MITVKKTTKTNTLMARPTALDYQVRRESDLKPLADTIDQNLDLSNYITSIPGVI